MMMKCYDCMETEKDLMQYASVSLGGKGLCMHHTKELEPPVTVEHPRC